MHNSQYLLRQNANKMLSSEKITASSCGLSKAQTESSLAIIIIKKYFFFQLSVSYEKTAVVVATAAVHFHTKHHLFYTFKLFILSPSRHKLSHYQK
jgi:hypothetical protein